MTKLILQYSALFFSVLMIGVVIVTSMHSNMFNLPSVVLNEPWFRTTLFDFYCNIAILSVWVVYKEARWWSSLLWILAFIILGTIATMFYVFLQINALKKGEGLEQALLRRK